MEDLTMDEKYLFFYTLGMKVAEAEMEKEAAKGKAARKAYKVLKEQLGALADQPGIKKYFKERRPNVLERVVGATLPTGYEAGAEIEKILGALGLEPKDAKKIYRALGAKKLPWYKGGRVSEALLRSIARHPTAAGIAGLTALLGGGYAAGKGIEALTD
jgi:hypothetical protein